MNKLSFYTMLAVLAIPLQANASTCPTTPTCEGLGYTYSESETGQYNFIRCPLDTSKVFYYRPEDIPCSPGMIYDETTHKCYNEFPATNTLYLYYILEKNGNDGIVLYLNQFGSNSTGSISTNTLKTMVSQTIEADGKEYFTSEELKKIWGKTPFVSGTASLYEKFGMTYSKVFVKDGYMDLNADLSYTFTAKDWSTNKYSFSANDRIYKEKVDLTGASNGTITPSTPPSCEDLGYTMSTDQCAGSMLKCPFDQNKAFCANF